MVAGLDEMTKCVISSRTSRPTCCLFLDIPSLDMGSLLCLLLIAMGAVFRWSESLGELSSTSGRDFAKDQTSKPALWWVFEKFNTN